MQGNTVYSVSSIRSSLRYVAPLETSSTQPICLFSLSPTPVPCVCNNTTNSAQGNLNNTLDFSLMTVYVSSASLLFYFTLWSCFACGIVRLFMQWESMCLFELACGWIIHYIQDMCATSLRCESTGGSWDRRMAKWVVALNAFLSVDTAKENPKNTYLKNAKHWWVDFWPSPSLL